MIDLHFILKIRSANLYRCNTEDNLNKQLKVFEMNKKAIFLGLIIALNRRDVAVESKSIRKYYLEIISFLINFTILCMDMLGNSKKMGKIQLPFVKKQSFIS